MKKALGLVMVAIVAIGVSASFAGEGCCPKAKAAAQAKAAAAASGGCEMAAKMNLTDEQKVKYTALQERIKRAPSTSEGHAIFEKGIQEILTPEQLAQCKASCEKDKGAAGCTKSGKADKKS